MLAARELVSAGGELLIALRSLTHSSGGIVRSADFAVGPKRAGQAIEIQCSSLLFRQDFVKQLKIAPAQIKIQLQREKATTSCEHGWMQLGPRCHAKVGA